MSGPGARVSRVGPVPPSRVLSAVPPVIRIFNGMKAPTSATYTRPLRLSRAPPALCPSLNSHEPAHQRQRHVPSLRVPTTHGTRRPLPPLGFLTILDGVPTPPTSPNRAPRPGRDPAIHHDVNTCRNSTSIVQRRARANGSPADTALPLACAERPHLAGLCSTAPTPTRTLHTRLHVRHPAARPHAQHTHTHTHTPHTQAHHTHRRILTTRLSCPPSLIRRGADRSTAPPRIGPPPPATCVPPTRAQRSVQPRPKGVSGGVKRPNHLRRRATLSLDLPPPSIAPSLAAASPSEAQMASDGSDCACERRRAALVRDGGLEGRGEWGGGVRRCEKGDARGGTRGGIGRRCEGGDLGRLRTWRAVEIGVSTLVGASMLLLGDVPRGCG